MNGTMKGLPRALLSCWLALLATLTLSLFRPAYADDANRSAPRVLDGDIPVSRMLHRGTPLFDNVKTVVIRIIYYPVAYRDDGQRLIPTALRREALQQMLTTAYKERFDSDAAALAKAHDNHWPLYGRTNPTFVLFDEQSRTPYFDLINQPDTLTVVLQVTCESAPAPDELHPAENFVLDLLNYRPAMRDAPWSLVTHPVSLRTHESESELQSKLHTYIISRLMR